MTSGLTNLGSLIDRYQTSVLAKLDAKADWHLFSIHGVCMTGKSQIPLRWLVRAEIWPII